MIESHQLPRYVAVLLIPLLTLSCDRAIFYSPQQDLISINKIYIRAQECPELPSSRSLMPGFEIDNRGHSSISIRPGALNFGGRNYAPVAVDDADERYRVPAGESRFFEFLWSLEGSSVAESAEETFEVRLTIVGNGKPVPVDIQYRRSPRDMF